MLYNTNDNHKKIAVALAGMWKQKLGIEAELVNQEWKVFLETRRNRQFADLARYGWIGDYGDANSFLGLLRGDIGDQNPAAYANPAFDDLMRKADLTADPAARARLMEEAERILLADHAIIPIFFYTRPLTVAPYVEGWVDNVMNYHLTRYISLKRR
jgi:oligopeptide transport system substrate-binding protein